MSETTITVTGRADAQVPPERATVSISVHLDGPDAAEPLRGATELAKRLTTELRQLHDPTAGPVTSWSSDQLRTWSARPWNADGVELPLVHHAAVGIRAEFSNFDGLSAWLGAAAQLSGVSVANIHWALLDETRDRTMSELRARAVQDATDKASSYAAAIGHTTVVPVALTEEDDGQLMRMSKVEYGGGADIEFTPTPVDIIARVEVRFATS
jgi:uncharacterized protein YggE